MRSTFRLMGSADFITLGNGLLGSLAIFFIILAVEDMKGSYDGLNAEYLWYAMLCVFLSGLGDIIDGPIARRYSKRRFLGGSLDLMSDTISFCLAPALLIFVMYGRMGEATPLWTISIALSCSWLVACGMLRLARFEYEKGSENNFFVGISSPTSAMFLISFAAVIWLQPATNFGPGLTTWDCSFCFGKGTPKPWGDFLILPAMFVSGGLMISDWKTSKLKHGIPLKLAVVQMLSLLLAIIFSLTTTKVSDSTSDLDEMNLPFVLFSTSLFLILVYIVGGKKFVPIRNNDEES